MVCLGREAETVLDAARDRYGRYVHHHAAAARAHRNRKALQAYAAYLAPHAGDLLAAARRVLDDLPHARHTTGWRALLDSLATAHTEIAQVLNQPAAPGTVTEGEQHTAVWPYLAFWAEHSYIATDLADESHQPEVPLTDEEQQMWTEMAQAAQRRGELDLIESWYAADGHAITLAHLFEDDASTVIALSGDPDSQGWRVIGHYVDEYLARQALPTAVQPGVLQPDVSRFNRPDPAPEVSLQELVRDVTEARAAGDVSEALLVTTRHGYDAGPLVRLHELLGKAGQFAQALETVRGTQVAARLAALRRQLDFLTHEVHEVAEELGASVAVLPPHRTPRPRTRPRPALDTPPPPGSTLGPATARHR
ncbi:hypothetical protein [Streptomyces sp. NPDC001508]|uniref:hypothetical protein n=1 Tax=Streptomyces sp. NPDC001508 TaxID=3154656 RepID=UPI003325CCE7